MTVAKFQLQKNFYVWATTQRTVLTMLRFFVLDTLNISVRSSNYIRNVLAYARDISVCKYSRQ